MKKFAVILFALLLICIVILFGMNYSGYIKLLIRNATDSIMDIGKDKTETGKDEEKDAADYETIDQDVLPSFYNSLENEEVNTTKDQGELGVCWAFAANAALESSLLPEEHLDFSEDHMIYNNGFGLDVSDGGDYIMAVTYLTSWKGPVLEEDDPYNDGVTNEYAEAVKHVQEVLFLDGKDYNDVKKLVYEYGAAESSLHISTNDQNYIDSEYYNDYYFSYCYDGSENANHEIVIIGWDDNYPKENFNRGAETDGAFICLNSWGSSFGDDGIFYVSYSDTWIADTAEIYSGIENTDNYDNIYQSDDCGWVGRIGFESPTAFFANVYTADSNESLQAVSFYATGTNTTYRVYVCSSFENADSMLNNADICAEGLLDYSGYYTIRLDQLVDISEGDKFAVIVEIYTPESEYPVAVEMNADDGRTRFVTIEGKESYISANGINWENTQEKSECNVCLKAFTNEQ